MARKSPPVAPRDGLLTEVLRTLRAVAPNRRATNNLRARLRTLLPAKRWRHCEAVASMPTIATGSSGQRRFDPLRNLCGGSVDVAAASVFSVSGDDPTAS
jgi:hypothetical protein